MLSFCCSLTADTISWWRFEAGDDLDPSANGFENPNEVSGEPSLISDNAVLGTQAPDLFNPIVPGPQVPNTGSVRSAINGNGNDGIFGTAAYSSTLDVASITVEFWIRTTENEAGFVARTTSGNTGESGSISDGFRIVDPQSVRVDFATEITTQTTVSQQDAIFGFVYSDVITSQTSTTATSVTTLDSGIAINDGDWHYVAFRYDAENIVASLTIDTTVTSVSFYQQSSTSTTVNSGIFSTTTTTEIETSDSTLYWGGGGAQSEVTVGDRLDGNPNNQTGTIDEIRFTDQFEDDTDLLSPIPEPGTVAFGFGLVIFVAFHEWRRRRVASRIA